MRTIAISEGHAIHVFDDLFPSSFRSDAFGYLKQLPLSLGWGDTLITEHQHHKYLHGEVSAADLDAMRMSTYMKQTELASVLEGLTLQKSILNVSVCTDAHFMHTHSEKKVALYYANLEWSDGWHGETLFFSENGKDIVFATPYTPGRVIVFDGAIPHAIRPQSRIAPQHRFTLAMIYDE